MKHELDLLVENHQGVLSRIARLFDGRDYSLESLISTRASEPDASRIRLVVSGAREAVEKAAKQLEKLVDVLEVRMWSLDQASNR
ncbi:MAG TPA: acetolactate synthase small subunit [Rectinemataceae bacterium]